MTTGAAAAVGAITLLLGVPAVTRSLARRGSCFPTSFELPPTQLRVRAVVVAGETRYELRFTSTAVNMGAGPLVVRLVRPSNTRTVRGLSGRRPLERLYSVLPDYGVGSGPLPAGP